MTTVREIIKRDIGDLLADFRSAGDGNLRVLELDPAEDEEAMAEARALGIRVIDTAMVALVGLHLGLSPWFFVALVVLFLVCLVGFLQYRLRTSPKTAKRMEWYAGMYVVAFDLTLAVEIVRKHGFVLVGS